MRELCRTPAALAIENAINDIASDVAGSISDLLGIGAAATGAATTTLTAADLGLSGNGINSIAGSVTNAGTTRVIHVGNIAAAGGALVGEIRGALPNMLNAARVDGIRTLQISGTFANGPLEKFVVNQAAKYGGTFSSAGGVETITFILK